MSDPTGTILHFTQARIPEVRFEWHPHTERVYAIQTRVPMPQADPIAFDVKNHGTAWNAVLVWCRGYMAHKINWALLGASQIQEIREDEHVKVFG